MPRVLSLATPAAVLAAAFAVAGCGGLDTDKLQDTVIEDAKKEGVTLTKVDCPSDVEAKKGEDFTCTATAEGGQALEIKVQQTDDEGNVRYELVPK